MSLPACGPSDRSAAFLSLPSRTIALAAVGDVVVALSAAGNGDNAAVVARNGTVAHRFAVPNAVDVAAAPDSADFLVGGRSASWIERRALDGRLIQSRPLRLHLDALGPEVDAERVGLVKRPGVAIAVRLDGRAIARFAPDVDRLGVCRLGPATYLVAASASGTSLVAARDGRRSAVAVSGVDATCIESLSGTVLAVVQRHGAGADLAILALPALQQIAALPLTPGAERISAGERAAYVLAPGTGASARTFARESLDFREQLIHDVHF